jgi:hypothetical protein
MPLARVRDIIEGPARVAGLTVDDALIVAAMNDAATDDALPLLAFALRELYDRFGQKNSLRLKPIARSATTPRIFRRSKTPCAAKPTKSSPPPSPRLKICKRCATPSFQRWSA